jgi:putative transposase
VVGPRARKLSALHALTKFRLSKRRAARYLGLARTTMTYKARANRFEHIEVRMTSLAAKYRKWGLPKIHHLLHEEGLVAKSKSQTERIYSKLGLQIRSRRRKKLPRVARVPFSKASKPNEIWSFDFVHDYVETARRLKCLTIVDDCSKRSPGILADYSITSRDLTNFFDRLPRLPPKLRCDNGPEMSSREFMDWARRKNIEIEFIEPGKPIQNAYVESFNSRFRYECLNEELFLDLEDARRKIERWRRLYNEKRPHSSLGMKTPKKFEEEFETET